MKTDEIIQEGTILVAIEDQLTTCGILYIRKDSIIKVAKDKPDWRKSVTVYRNQNAEKEINWHIIDMDKVREAILDEIKLWENEVYFINQTNTIES